eukprot:CAMPEP_0202717976 /NCGR_PEP_ID=MMETSP1385-20130828/117257_1 /ASSEMBLY_ACC=CAM_ASM_000861 /TAXON_ID=933848 /ORGANISM="Elphidium margaritaceum" /LENGTH=70 /DNA_ID=CAMNT_0049380483 /DNA_START=54 /DNA_END=262 /DNA_ORIENTATION=-
MRDGDTLLLVVNISAANALPAIDTATDHGFVGVARDTRGATYTRSSATLTTCALKRDILECEWLAHDLLR